MVISTNGKNTTTTSLIAIWENFKLPHLAMLRKKIRFKQGVYFYESGCGYIYKWHIPLNTLSQSGTTS